MPYVINCLSSCRSYALSLTTRYPFASRSNRVMMTFLREVLGMSKKGSVIWLTGISGAGKTTLSIALKKELESRGKQISLLDGDVVRDLFEGDLGVSKPDRIMNVRRVTFAAAMLADAGVDVIVANIAPYFEVRDFIRRKIKNYYQIYVKTSVETVQKRDVKGLYAKFEKGEIKNLVGLDDPYEEPRCPDITVDSSIESEQDSLKRILEGIEKSDLPI